MVGQIPRIKSRQVREHETMTVPGRMVDARRMTVRRQTPQTTGMRSGFTRK
jgi:hypothetical protein